VKLFLDRRLLLPLYAVDNGLVVHVLTGSFTFGAVLWRNVASFHGFRLSQGRSIVLAKVTSCSSRLTSCLKIKS